MNVSMATAAVARVFITLIFVSDFMDKITLYFRNDCISVPSAAVCDSKTTLL